MARLSVLLVTHNAQDDIAPCLQALAAQTCGDWEAIVVDNASTDATCDRIHRCDARIQLLRNAANPGFAAALNQALARATGAYALTLNPDVVLAPDCLEWLLEAAGQSEPSVGLFSPKLLRADRRTIDSTGLRVNRAWRVFDRGAGQPDHASATTISHPPDILGPCGAAGCYRRTMLEALREDGRVFDESFFLLMEDVDLAWRARRAGWRSRYVPEAVAYHRGGFSRRFSWRAQSLAFRNRYYLIAKHHTWGWRDLPWLAGYDAPRLGWLLLTNPYTPRRLWELGRALPRLRQARLTRGQREDARVDVLGVAVEREAPPQVVERLLQLAATGAGVVAMYANAHTLNLAWENAAYRALLRGADLVYADGMGAVWAARRLGAPPIERASFADIYEPFCAQAQARGLRSFLLGARPSVAEQAARRLRQRWPRLQIVGTHHGYFEEEASAAVAALIAGQRADVVLVGMGSPRQERWARVWGAASGARLVWCVGGALDLLAGVEPWAPRWMRRCGGEWLYRLGRHPVRLGRRYLVGLPRFAWRVLRRRPPDA